MVSWFLFFSFLTPLPLLSCLEAGEKPADLLFVWIYFPPPMCSPEFLLMVLGVELYLFVKANVDCDPPCINPRSSQLNNLKTVLPFCYMNLSEIYF